MLGGAHAASLGPWPSSVDRYQAALTVNAMPRKSQRQNATEFRNAQLSVVSCKPLGGVPIP